jgi:hypothetical protein
MVTDVPARLRQLYDIAKGAWRDHSPAGREIARRRARTERKLDAMARGVGTRFDGTVLIDGTFDNPNFWFRFSLLRTALGIAQGREIGAIGPYRRNHMRSTFARSGINDVVDLAAQPREAKRIRERADALLAKTRSAEDVLNWSLPEGVNPVILYDALLKRQRLAALDPNHPEMRPLTHEGFERIARAAEVLDETKPDLVVISHTIGLVCGPLAYLAAARGIPVVLVFGLFGALRFARFDTTEELFSFYDRPTRAEIDNLPSAQADAMAAIGRTYLAQRFGGKADDLASVYAYRNSQNTVDRAEICSRFGWNPDTPIVAFYGSNWFDWPHQLGMTQFRDFLDWTEATFAVARRNNSVNWLFKPHPTEDWFGGVALADIMKRLGSMPHVAVSDKSWNNAQVMRAIDALVTYHGTAGIEFASLGKPVLVPDRGKYDDCGFVRVASSREEYLSLLEGRWWDGIDLQDARRRAEIFSGWWFCAPSWQGRFILADDSRQDELYDGIVRLLEDNPAEAEHEIRMLGQWWNSGHRYYHTWKMAQSDAYQLSNV